MLRSHQISSSSCLVRQVFNILGEGCFGQVWKCEALDIDGKSGATIVAVKTLKENATERERLDLAQELRVMKNLDPHPNVVRLLGCCTEREPMFVILEYVSGGKLQSFLRASREERNHGGPGLTSRDLTGFVYQVFCSTQSQTDYFNNSFLYNRNLNTTLKYQFHTPVFLQVKVSIPNEILFVLNYCSNYMFSILIEKVKILKFQIQSREVKAVSIFHENRYTIN